jgi:Ca2+-binding RTX toxin-like protein
MAFHLFHIAELYSNSDGSVQYIELLGETDGQPFLVGHTITVQGDSLNEYQFTDNLPSSSTAGKSMLLATQKFADLGVVTPDFIIPEDFLFIDGGTITFPADQLTNDVHAYEALPVDGTSALDDDGASVFNSPENFAGTTGSIPGNPIFGTVAANTLTGTSGRDFMIGLDGNDVMTGGSGADTIRGGAGADNLNGGGGIDRIQGEAGNDKMTWGAGDFFDGGANTDTLRVGVASLNLTTAANSNNRLLNIEQIDLRAGAHTLTLNRSDVLAMSPTDTVKILGDGADTVDFVPIEAEGGRAPLGFTRYTINGAVLIIDSDINVT